MKSFEHSSYGGELFRPQPEIWIDEGGSFIAILTAWGKTKGVHKSIDRLKEFLENLSEDFDEDVTSAFENLEELSFLGNRLRNSVLMLNEALLEEENKHEYKLGFEIFLGGFRQNELTWIQYGQPSVYFIREKRPVINLGLQTDFSLDHSISENTLPPLPKHLLGLFPLNTVYVNTTRIYKGDRLLFLSRSLAPQCIEKIEDNKRDMKSLRRFLSQDDKTMPFWMGLLEVDEFLR